MAQLIFDQQMSGLYSQAAGYCRQALSLLPFETFPFPGKLLALLTIIDNPEDRVIDNLKNLMQEYHISKKTIAVLSYRIADPGKKEIIAGWSKEREKAPESKMETGEK